MGMKPVLDSVRALYRKLEREAYRAIHAKTSSHKADHFFNFCVTAHAMRDFYLEEKGIPQRSTRAQVLHTTWNADPLLVAAREIANLSKHFRLRDRRTNSPTPSKTRRLVRRQGEMVDIYIDRAGDIRAIPRPSPEIRVTLSDGTRYDLWEFVIDVTEVWREFLKTNGVRVRRQNVSELLDE